MGPDDFEDFFRVDWLEALVNEDEAPCLELTETLKDFELQDVVLERVLVFSCEPPEKLAGNTRFLAGG